MSARLPLPGWLILLGALTAVGPLSIDMYLPSFPALELALGRGAELTLACFFIGLALGQLFYGPLSDRFGRKPPLYVGVALYLLASLACALAVNIEQLAALRLLQGLGGCAGMVLGRAIVRDRCDARSAAQAFSLLMLVMGLAPILAPLLGGWLLLLADWRAIFAFQALFGLACLLAVHWGLAESHTQRSAAPLALGSILRGYGALLGERHFLAPTLAGGMAQAGMFAYIAGSPSVLIAQYGISPQHYGWVFGANALGLIAASQLNARQLARHAPAWLLQRALWAPALAGVGLLLISLLWQGQPPLWLLLPGLFGFVASLGYIGPNAAASALAGQGERAGSASALLGALQFALATLAGLAMALGHGGGSLPLAAAMAVCGLGALLALRIQPRAEATPQPA
ncbi:multidrug effflux MFS transporter [Chitinimonas taiwanensis]|uniref:multidrug effflux MFS transporter n=1 Tax=Chitinimonas taiwanensis TaxID=240412 RepID=UPI0035AE3C69